MGATRATPETPSRPAPLKAYWAVLRATPAGFVDANAVVFECSGNNCRAAIASDPNAANSADVMPFGWLRRHDGSAAAVLTTGGVRRAAISSDPSAANLFSVCPFGWLWRPARG